MKAQRFHVTVVVLLALLPLAAGSTRAQEIEPRHNALAQPDMRMTSTHGGFGTKDSDLIDGYFDVVPSGGSVPRFPICTETHNQGHPGVAYDPAINQFLVVWADFRTDSSVLASPVYLDEPHVGSEFAVEDYPGYQPMTSAPVVAYNASTHQFLVVWQDLRNSPDTGVDLYGRLAKADSVTGPEFPISTAEGSQTSPAVAYNTAANQFLVVWEDTRLGDFSDIYGRIVNANGSMAGNELPISIVYEGQAEPAVAYNAATNQYLVVWVDASYSPSLILARFVDADGSLGVFEFPLAPTTGAQDYPDIVYNASTNQFLVVWKNGSNIYGRIVNADGSMDRDPFAICNAEGEQRHPAVAYAPSNGRFLVVWEDDRNWDDIYARELNADGSMASDEFAVATTSTHLEVPVVAYSSAAHEFLVVWKHEYCASLYDCQGYDIYGAFLAESDMPGQHKVFLPIILGSGSARGTTRPIPPGWR